VCRRPVHRGGALRIGSSWTKPRTHALWGFEGRRPCPRCTLPAPSRRCQALSCSIGGPQAGAPRSGNASFTGERPSGKRVTWASETAFPACPQRRPRVLDPCRDCTVTACAGISDHDTGRCPRRQRKRPKARNAPRSRKPRNSTTSHRATYEINHQGLIVKTSVAPLPVGLPYACEGRRPRRADRAPGRGRAGAGSPGRRNAPAAFTPSGLISLAGCPAVAPWPT
jgi:hypothetical protein